MPPKKNYICPVCSNLIKRHNDSINCNSCNEWIHQKGCCCLNIEEFTSISQVDSQWNCSKCIAQTLPFYNTNTNDIMLDNLGISNSVYDFRINPDNEFAEFINDCNKASTDFNETFREEFTEEFPTMINSKYYNLNEINQIKHDKKSSWSPSYQSGIDV